MKTLIRAAACAPLILGASQALAADLGGNCCADLEERIAELEATVARKGNRKVSVTVYGQVNKAIAHGWGGGESDTVVLTDNTVSETFVGVAGEAKVSGGVKVGYVLEIQDGIIRGIDDDVTGAHELVVHQSFAYIKSDTLGSLSVGQRSTATDNIYGSVANTSAAIKPMTLQPYFSLEPFNGARRDSVRYDSPSIAGFVASASWVSDDDTIDLALRWSGEVAGFQAMASAGYQDFDANSDVLSLSAGAKHVSSGVFLNAYYGRMDGGLDAWQLLGGLERKLTDLGPTTLYVNYGEFEGERAYGLGVVQSLVEGADVYADYKHVLDANAIMAGARLKF